MGPEISAASCVDRPGSCCRAAADGSDARSRFAAGLPSTGAAAAPAWSGAGLAEGVLAVATAVAAGVLVAGSRCRRGSRRSSCRRRARPGLRCRCPWVWWCRWSACPGPWSRWAGSASSRCPRSCPSRRGVWRRWPAGLLPVPVPGSVVGVVPVSVTGGVVSVPLAGWRGVDGRHRWDDLVGWRAAGAGGGAFVSRRVAGPGPDGRGDVGVRDRWDGVDGSDRWDDLVGGRLVGAGPAGGVRVGVRDRWDGVDGSDRWDDLVGGRLVGAVSRRAGWRRCP